MQLTKYIISYHIISCRIVSYHITSHHIVYHIVSHHITSHIISYHIISYHIISYHIISYHIISYHIISYHVPYHIVHFSPENNAVYEVMRTNAAHQHLVLPRIFYLSLFLTQIFAHFVPFPVRVTLSAHPTLFHFIAIKFGEEFTLRSSSAWIFSTFLLLFPC